MAALRQRIVSPVLSSTTQQESPAVANVHVCLEHMLILFLSALRDHKDRVHESSADSDRFRSN